MRSATYIINQLPTGMLSNKSPFQTLFLKTPTYDVFKVFGCTCFPWLTPYTTNKLQNKSKSCVFLGYSLNHQGYKCLDFSTRRIYVSRHVLFNEDSFPFKDLTSSKGGSFSSSNYNPDALFVFHESTNEVVVPRVCQPSPPLNISPTTQISQDTQPLASPLPQVSPPNPTIHVLVQESVPQNPSEPVPEGGVSSIADTTSLQHTSPMQSHMVTRSQLGVCKPNPKYALNATIDVTYHESRI